MKENNYKQTTIGLRKYDRCFNYFSLSDGKGSTYYLREPKPYNKHIYCFAKYLTRFKPFRYVNGRGGTKTGKWIKNNILME